MVILLEEVTALVLMYPLVSLSFDDVGDSYVGLGCGHENNTAIMMLMMMMMMMMMIMMAYIFWLTATANISMALSDTTAVINTTVFLSCQASRNMAQVLTFYWWWSDRGGGTYSRTYAHRSRWSIGHLRPLAIALCSGLLWPFQSNWSIMEVVEIMIVMMIMVMIMTVMLTILLIMITNVMVMIMIMRRKRTTMTMIITVTLYFSARASISTAPPDTTVVVNTTIFLSCQASRQPAADMAYVWTVWLMWWWWWWWWW